jgi:two-component system chemotaxis response regulator CheY
MPGHCARKAADPTTGRQDGAVSKPTPCLSGNARQQEHMMSIDKSMNVLIVDDYKTMLRIIRNLLKQIDFNNVEEATDGADALAKLRANNFGLVISDWNMQPMTGLQLLQEVRADARLKAMPFIMITAESKVENVVAAKQAGVSNYIVKPFNAETLREKIEKVLGHA